MVFIKRERVNCPHPSRDKEIEWRPPGFLESALSGYDSEGTAELRKLLLEATREELEKLVSPYVTARKQPDAIFFQGKRCYCKFIESREDYYACLALQMLYKLMHAWKNKDIDKIVVYATSFSEFYTEFIFYQYCGYSTISAKSFLLKYKNTRRGSRKDKRKLMNVPTVIFEMGLAKHGNRRDWLERLTEEVKKYTGKDVHCKTVSSELRARGIKRK